MDSKALERAVVKAMAWHPSEDGPGYQETEKEVIAAIHAAFDTASSHSFSLEWIAGARPPVHPNPMRGRQSFATFDLAIAFMRRQAPDARFASLTERIEREVDRTADARTALKSFGSELPEIDGLRWLRPGGLMPNVIRAETEAGDYYITNGDRIAVSGPLNGHFDTVEDAISAVVRHHAASTAKGGGE